jgi:Mg2+ and Co2+ transporter CorA
MLNKPSEKRLRDLKDTVYRLFNDDVMIGLAAILACTVLLPLFFEFTPVMEAIFEAVNYFIIAAFVAEYVLKLYVAPWPGRCLKESRVSFVTNPWHVLDLLIIVIALFDFSKLAYIPYISDKGNLSPLLRLLRVLLRVLLVLFIGKRTKKRIDPEQKIEVIDPQTEMQISTLKLDQNGNNVIYKCSMKESGCSILTDERPLWIDFQHIAEMDLKRIEKETAIQRNVLESKLIKESFPRIDDVNGTPHILLWDSHLTSTDPSSDGLNIFTNDMLVVYENNRIITLSRGGSDLFEEISRQTLPLEKEEFSVRVLYSLLHRKIDDYGEIVQSIERRTIGFEEISVNRTSPEFLEETFHFKKEIQKISSNLWHFNQVLHHIKDNKNLLRGINDGNSHYFDNLHAESEYMYETAQNIRESLISLIELHINTVSYDMNQVMKVIAVITCLAIIPSIIGGLLGVNLMDNPYPLKITEVFFLVFSLMLLGIYTFYKMNWLK